MAVVAACAITNNGTLRPGDRIPVSLGGNVPSGNRFGEVLVDTNTTRVYFTMVPGPAMSAGGVAVLTSIYGAPVGGIPAGGIGAWYVRLVPSPQSALYVLPASSTARAGVALPLGCQMLLGGLIGSDIRLENADGWTAGPLG
jgi:hypothetical protein